MAFLIPSVGCGIGSGYLATFMRGGLGQAAMNGAVAPTFGAAFTYGMASSLASRGIEHIASGSCDYFQVGEKETVLVTTAVIALQMLAAYEISNQLRRRLDIVVSKNYIHLENVLFMASVLEVDFDLTANRINKRVWTHAVDHRLPVQAWGFVQLIFDHLQFD